jgi:ADP-ribosylglycohydrolase
MRARSWASLIGTAVGDALGDQLYLREGTGRQVSAPDTVPLALWVVARHPDDYEEAIWTVAPLAEDVDTLCAIVGGIIAGRVGEDGIPAAWRQAAEPLPGWV